ncbi:hypothetical protein ANCDUO_23151 [Ancylostoma duodenale]|uniref:Pyridoxal-dependent decarboxylase domain protein n=1 Tax=Ancylostoma duodenale TaxID=51022 RepID=A0A0C2BSE5_9BILA|nr:hypothetical protein ANCDUO_23151 [Ancylostoma duodenale]
MEHTVLGNDERNQQLLTRLNSSGRIHMVPASLNDRFVIRFCVCAENATDKDIETAYAIISQTAQHILHEGTSLPIVEDQEAEQLEEAGYEVNAAPLTSVIHISRFWQNVPEAWMYMKRCGAVQLLFSEPRFGKIRGLLCIGGVTLLEN